MFKVREITITLMSGIVAILLGIIGTIMLFGWMILEYFKPLKN